VLVHCPVCTQRNRIEPLPGSWTAECARCGTTLQAHRPWSSTPVLVYTLAALALYAPANLLPVLSMERLGAYSETTIWSGCASLLADGYWGVALIVFLASIAIPLLKLLSLLYLAAAPPESGNPLWRTRVHRLVHLIGPWSMLDVFLVAILVALVKLGDIARVSAEPGLAAFTGVVVLTMLASASFDPRRLWHARAA